MVRRVMQRMSSGFFEPIGRLRPRAWLWPALLLAAACAEEREPIDRVQPNALDKAVFVGTNIRDTVAGRQDDPEFYYRATVIDVGYGAQQAGLFTSTWAQPLSRIKWQITENYLNARLTYERIANSDHKGHRTTSDGQLVASFRILSHFDIAREYNPTTGEQLNVVVENSSDRPWYERQYMRVDWSQNLITDAYDFDTLTMMGFGGGYSYEPVAYTNLDPDDLNAPVFDETGSYFDFTNQVFAEPKMVDISGLGWGVDEIPACLFPAEIAGGTAPSGNCNPIELTLRLSFKAVVDQDYEPMDVDGLRFQAFGNFTTERKGYERSYGMLDEHWQRFASRYNLWQRSHYYRAPDQLSGEVPCATPETTTGPTGDPGSDPDRDADRNGTADECEEVTELSGLAGSQCDRFRQRCTLPYRLRVPRTLTWYINGDTRGDLFEPTDWATQEWDLTLRSTVRTARLVECRRTGGTDCEQDPRLAMWTGEQQDNQDAAMLNREVIACRRAQGWTASACTRLGEELARQHGLDPVIATVVTDEPLLVLCHNPVIPADHPACGPAGTVARLGDLRFNNILLIETPQTPSPWGIMVDCDDPLTGEKVAASINIWSDVTDYAARNTTDLIRFANGELSVEEITNGEYIRAWAKAGQLDPLPTLTAEDVTARLAAASRLPPDRFQQLAAQMATPAMEQLVQPLRHQLLDAAQRADAPSAHQAVVQARLQAARGSRMEAELLNPAMLQRAGLPAGLPLQGVLQELASPLALNNPRFLAELFRLRENGLAERGACILNEAPEATGITGLADLMREKFPIAADETPEQRFTRVAAMEQYIRRRFHYSVIIHEMGHSIGHRHNFVSSYDALFFRPQYWQLRTKNGQVTKVCDGPVADGADCIGPRYHDPLTEEERTGLLPLFEHSSVMDYPGDIVQDFMGLGAYDWAATRFFYADVAPVYADEDTRAGTPIGVGLTLATDTFGGMKGISFNIGVTDLNGQLRTREFHYSELQNQYQLIRDCQPVQPTPPSWWNEALDGRYLPSLDGLLVAVDGVYTRCQGRPVDYVAWRDLRMPNGDARNGTPETGGGYFRGGPSIDPQGRIRVPYGFATDHWADTGNLSVFRHDAGADPYEQVMFFITTKEDRHILDNYRRGRSTFSVRTASQRTYARYLEKMLSAYGGVGFMFNANRDWATAAGIDFNLTWVSLVNSTLRDNIIAASMAFDQFTRELSRPEAGGHYQQEERFQDPVLRSGSDPDGNPGPPCVVVPNGSTGQLRDIGFGGRPLENQLEENGDFSTDYPANAGAYYDKIATAILMAESEDRFISQSRGDFYDARFRSVGYQHIFPEGVRRVLANALTNDRAILAPHLEAGRSGLPKVVGDQTGSGDLTTALFPARPIGWTAWWPLAEPLICFPAGGRNSCTSPDGGDDLFAPDQPRYTVPLDPQIGWEVQKFLIAWTLLYITEDQTTGWIDMLRVYRAGEHATPTMANRIEWEDPETGQLWYAARFGRETLFGREVERGIAARVLEYANELTARAYQSPGTNEFGRVLIDRQASGAAIVIPDPATFTFDGFGRAYVPEPCDPRHNERCTPLTPEQNRFTRQLHQYKSVPEFLLETMMAYGLGRPEQLGLRDL